MAFERKVRTGSVVLLVVALGFALPIGECGRTGFSFMPDSSDAPAFEPLHGWSFLVDAVSGDVVNVVARFLE